MAQFNERFLTEIAYYKRSVPKFLTAYAYKGEFDVLLRTYYKELLQENVGGRRTFSVGKEELPFLSADEISFIHDYFLTIGKGDSRSQQEYFSAAKGNLQTISITAKKIVKNTATCTLN